MSNSVASEFNERHKSYKTGGNSRAEDEGNEDEEEILDLPSAESLPTSTIVSTVPPPINGFMHTIEFKICFAAFIHEQTLIALRILNKEWNGVAHALIVEGLRSGELIVHVGKDEHY